MLFNDASTEQELLEYHNRLDGTSKLPFRDTIRQTRWDGNLRV